MRLLRVTVDGILPYKDGHLSLDFYASDRVVKSAGQDLPEDVCRCGTSGSIYSQNVIGISGVNASGKSTTLNVLSFVLSFLPGPMLARMYTADLGAGVRPSGSHVTVEVVFWHGNHYYLLRTRVRNTSRKKPGQKIGRDAVSIDDEWLWRLGPVRVTKKMIGSPDSFIENASLLIHREGAPGEPGSLSDGERRFLDPGDSVVVSVLKPSEVQAPAILERKLPMESLPSDVVQAFDASVEHLEWIEDNGVYELRFKGGETQYVNYDTACSLLSRGTIVGTEAVIRAIDILKTGSCLLIDEIELALNRALVSSIVGLFTSPVTNPRGAQLVFTTHDPEVLDSLHRKDSVYLLIRDSEYRTEAVKYSTRFPRIENKKSEVVLSNTIAGTMPRYPDVRAMRQYVKEHVNA